jgi:hypothetical protein
MQSSPMPTTLTPSWSSSPKTVNVTCRAALIHGAGATSASLRCVKGWPPGSGAPVRVQGVDLLEFRGGWIIRQDSYWKMVERSPA